MVEGMSVYCLLPLMSVIRPPLALYNPSVVKVVCFWSFCFKDELGFLNCDDICMRVVRGMRGVGGECEMCLDRSYIGC